MRSQKGEGASSKLNTATSGKAMFFRRSHLQPLLHVATVSDRHSYSKIVGESKRIYYVECRNVHCIPRMGKKCSIAILKEDQWHLGMLASLPNNKDVIHYFEWIGGDFDVLSHDARWEDYSKYFKFCSEKNAKCVFLNQINGIMAGGRQVKPDIINENDEGIQNSAIGCDLLLPKYVIIPYKHYFQTVSKQESTTSVTNTLPTLLRPFCNNKGKRKIKSRHASNIALNYNHAETVVYVQDCPELRTKVDKSHAVNCGIIPVPYLTSSNASKFAYLSVKHIKTLKRLLHGSTLEKHDSFLDDHAESVDNLVIIDESDFQHHLSIRLIDNNVEETWMQSNKVLQSSSPIVLKQESEQVQKFSDYIPGSVSVSTWVRCKEVNHHDVSWDDVNVFFKAYSHVGFGNRNCVKSVGFTQFQGLRNEGNRSMPSPVSGPGTQSNVQYYRSYYNPLYQAIAEKITNVLATAAESTARALDVNIHSVLPNHKCPPGYKHNTLGTCHKKIITSEVPGKWLGYASCQHLYSVDLYKKNKKEEVLAEKEKLKNSKATFDLKRAAYLDEFEKFGSYGRKTTCVYQFLCQTEHEDCEVIIYFLLQGLGIAVRFDSHISHSFFGYLFTHCTALPVIVKNGRVYYYHEKIVIFAWGAA